MIVFEVAIDTIFMCFLIDEHCNKQNGKMFASKTLLEVIDYQAATSIRESHHMKQTTLAHQLEEKDLEEIRRRGTTYEMAKLDDYLYDKDVKKVNPL